MVSLVGKSEGKGKLWIDGKETDSVEGEWKAEYLLSGGYHTLAYEGKTVTLHVQCEGSLLELESPVLLADGRKRAVALCRTIYRKSGFEYERYDVFSETV